MVRAGLYAVLILGLIVVGPFVWMLLSSVKSEAEIRAVPPTWWPPTFTWENFHALFTRLNFRLYFFNSAFVAALVTAGNLMFCSLLGYALAKLNSPGAGRCSWSCSAC